MSLREEIEAFFAAYVDAFARWDIHAICVLWAPTAAFVMPTANVAMDAAAFRDNGVKLLDFYRRQQVAWPEGKLLSRDELFPGVAEARMAYRLFDAAGAEIVAWKHVYMLRKTDRWRAVLAVADGEIAAWAERGTPLGSA